MPNVRAKSASPCASSRGKHALLGIAPSLLLACAAQAQSVGPSETPAADAQTQSQDLAGRTQQILPSITVNSSTVTEANETASQRVAAQGVNNFVVTDTTTGSKIALPNSSVPQTVSSVPLKAIVDEGAQNVSQALQNVAGVFSPYPPYYPLDQLTSTYIRGFPVSVTLRDGLWDPTPFGNGWISNVQRVEVLKGPSGLMYGAYSGGIGGVINVVTKQPLPYRQATISAGVDTYGSKYVSGDLSTPLMIPTWAMRANFNLGDYESFYNNSGYRKRDASVVFSGQLSDQDFLTFGYEYRWQKSSPYSGLPGYASVGSGAKAYLRPLGVFPDSLNVYDPRSYWTYQSNTARAVYEHKFNEDWSFKSSNQFTVTSRDATSIGATPSFTTSLTPKYTQYYQQILMGPVYAFDTDNMINGHFDTFGLKHNVIFGERYTNEHYAMNMQRPTPYTFSSYYFTNPLYPNWGQPAKNVSQYMYGYSYTDQFNSYFNDVISLTDKWRLSGGVNYVNYETYSRSGMNPLNMSSSKTNGNGPAWRLGTLYDILPGVTPYLSYSTTFQPQATNVTTTGVIQTFDPLTGDQWEGGVKYQIDNKSSLTASVYQIELSNVTAQNPDPTLATEGFEVQTGKQRSRGIELDGGYTIQPGWDFLIAYTNLDARIVSDSTYVVGSRVPYIPHNSVHLWSTYEFQDGTFKGLGLGGGLTAFDNRTSNLQAQATPNLVAQLGGGMTVDALVYYKYKNLRLSANIYNIFNEGYWAGASTSYTYLFPGEPRRANFRMDISF